MSRDQDLLAEWRDVKRQLRLWYEGKHPSKEWIGPSLEQRRLKIEMEMERGPALSLPPIDCGILPHVE